MTTNSTDEISRDGSPVRPCPACGHESSDTERRGGIARRGRAPRLCIGCQNANPGGRWCARCDQIEFTRDCPLPGDRARAVKPVGTYSKDTVDPCVACGRLSTAFERRGGTYSRGAAPELCYPCQQANPGKRWCKRCEEFESGRNCPARLRVRDDAQREAGKYRSQRIYECEDCGATGTPSELRPGSSGRVKRCAACHEVFLGGQVTCSSCEQTMSRRDYFGEDTKRNAVSMRACVRCTELHAGEQWCVTHRRFEPPEAFSGWSIRTCREGIIQNQAGGDLRMLMQVHGAEEGQCMCCFRPVGRHAMTDHDHDCCVRVRSSCGKCTRGYLCIDCNVIEGKIRNVYGPPFPRLIQEYLDRYAAYRATLE